MKRYLFGVIALLTLVIACSKEEEPAPVPTPKFSISISAGEGGSVSTTGGTYDSGTKVTVTATPEGEFLFEKWSDGSTDNPREITITSNLSLSASFAKKKYALTVNIEGEGTVKEEVVVQGSASTTEYNSGTTVKLTALAEDGWMFTKWMGDIESTENSITIDFIEDKMLTAQFSQTQEGYVFDVVGEGTVQIQSINSDKVKLIPKAADGWILDHWSGNFGISNQEILFIDKGAGEVINVVFREIPTTQSVFGSDNISMFYGALQELSNGWTETEVANANNFLNQFSYVEEDLWFILFDHYFEENFFNENLWSYLIYPAFYWLGEEVNEKVQIGLSRVILKKLVVSAIETKVEKEQAFQILRALGEYLISLRDGRNQFELNFLSDLVYYQEMFIKTHGDLFTYQQILTGQEIEDYGDTKAQLYYNVSGIYHYLDYPKGSITDLLGLNSDSVEFEIFNRFNVLIIDNQFFTIESLNLIRDVFAMIPSNYHNVMGLTQQGAISNPHKLKAIGGFNVFELNTGIQVENSFPNEVAPFYSDLFYIVLIHELTHNIDFHLISKDSALNEHRLKLIEMAGVDQENYLRSVIDSGYFMSNPQEFVASIANMYLTNTALTFDVAIKRAKNQNFHPLNQFLFFARFFSDDEFLSFYNYNENGHLEIKSAQYLKNDFGFITQLNLEGETFQFLLDSENLVEGVLITSNE